MQIPMIDTLQATIDIKDYENVAKDLLSRLENKKNEAKLAKANNASEKVLINIGNMSFEIMQNGSKGYAYILHNDYYEVKFAQFRSKKDDFYPIFVRVKSECLWSKGPKQSWEEILQWLFENVGLIVNNKISRLDLCCHTDELKLTLNDIEKFKGKFSKDEVIRNKRKVTGINFGSRNSNKIYCRIYNKTEEVNKKKKKLWFKEIWNKAGLKEKEVWNVEFEILRGFFKEFNIDSVEDAFDRLKSIWEYCTKEWLVKVKLDRTRIERSTLDETWLNIQKAFLDYESKELIKREYQLQADASALVPGAIGNITSYAARKGITDINLILTLLKNEGERYLELSRNIDLVGIINKKMAIIK